MALPIHAYNAIVPRQRHEAGLQKRKGEMWAALPTITDLQKKTCRRQWREIAEEKSEQGYYSNPPFQHFPCRVQNQEKICLERKVSSPARSFMMYHIRRFASLKTDLSAAFLTGVRLCLPCTRIDISCDDAMGREVNFVWLYTGFGKIAIPRLRKCCRQL